jgi:hypothetical protein
MSHSAQKIDDDWSSAAPMG